MKKICVVFGGESVEHDISIITGMQLAKNLKAKQNVEKIYLSLENRFFLASKCENLSNFQEKNKISLQEVFFMNGAVYKKSVFMKKLFDVDCVVNCCHGGVGENGDLAGFFAVNEIRLTSAPSLPSHIAMDKSLAKEILKDIVPTIKGFNVKKENAEEMFSRIETELGDDLIVKPNSLGSSIGVKACNKENFREQVEAIFELNDDALVEERVVNIKEYNQACFRDGDELVLSAIENPLSKSEFLTFDEKYKSQGKAKGQDRVIPARISKKLEKQIGEFTKQIYSILNMSGVVRIDYIFDADENKLYFNEINTIPGSMAFYLYEPLGIDYITLVERLIENANDIKKFAYLNTQILNNKKI